MRKIILAALTLSLLITSCTVSEKLTLKTSASGNIRSAIMVEDFFVEVIEDFSEFLPKNNESILEGGIKDFTNQLKNSRHTNAVSYQKPEENHYHINLDFNNLNNLLTELSKGNGQSLITVKDNRLDFFLDINNYNELKNMIPFLSDPNFEVFLPEYNIGYTEDEYLEMIVFLLGEEAPEKIKNSFISLQIKLPGNITNYRNVKKLSSDTALFEFELIDFLLLSTPLSFSVSWK